MVPTLRRSLALLCASVVVAAVVGASLGSAAPAAPSRDLDGVFQQTGGGTTPTNNTTVQQEDPTGVDSKGDIPALQGWLSGRLGQTVINCSKGVNVGNYDACNRSKGEYPKWLDDYVNVTRDDDSNANRTNAFERTAENQTEYASEVHRFRNTVDKYHDARNNSDTQHARLLARRAQRIATRVNATSANLTRGYRTITNGTNRSLSAATNATRTTSRNVTTTADSLSAEQFLNTTISASSDSRRISFRKPLRVTGRVVTANGTGLANGTVQLRADDRTRRTTTTNSTGRYHITYRPTVASLDTERVTLRYLPRNLSAYNGNETSVPVTVRQVQPTLRANATPSRVRLGDVVTINGTLSVDDIGVQSVPVAVSVDGEEFTLTSGERARTASNGRFGVSARLPKEVDPGRRNVRVMLPFTNRALGRANASLPITVRSTPTALSVNASQTSVNGSNVNGPVVRVAGRLTTIGGTPVRNESIALGVNGTNAATTTTDQNGRYVANVSVPKHVFADGAGTVPVSVVASYTGASTNLESSRARTSLRLEVPTQPTDIIAELREALVGVLTNVPRYGWVMMVIAVLLVGYAAPQIRTRSRSERSEDPTTDATESDGMATANDTTSRDALLQAASEQLFAGDQAGAVATAYAAVRTKLQHDLGLTAAYTHWEFLDASRDAVGGHRRNALQRLTELYEHAAFSPYPLSDDRASTALKDAKTVTESDEETSEKISK